MTPDQQAALLVLRNDIAEQIDGDSPTDSRYTDWAALADIALGVGIDPWHYMTLAPDIKKAMEKNMTPDQRRSTNMAPKLAEVLREGTAHDRDVATMRNLAKRFVDNAPIVGADKEFAAQIISEYARFVRVARAALAEYDAPSIKEQMGKV